MHIKKLTICGFKSYRDAVVVDPFSPGVNVVVGRNGSGKSNFFAAIRFVLSDETGVLSKQARQSLLHEGVSNTATFSAYVELVFDNSDNRFPTGKDEVILRRTIGSKKDEYSLDRKSTGKGEVLSLLESAGFSRSNPYYIVPQGRITHLTNQKDPERLDLLKEVAGTKVYEDRRAESMKIIEETDTKRAKIDELLDYIDERLEELEEEKEELKEYTSKDRERRCLEYSIYQRELTEVSEALEQIEDERAEGIDSANAAREAFLTRQKELGVVERALEELKQQVALLELEKTQITTDRKEALKAKTQVECIIRDLSDDQDMNASAKENLEAELANLQEAISEKERRLEDLSPRCQAALQREQDVKQALEDASARMAALYAKQGRATQFRTQRERDTYLNGEIDKLNRLIPTAQTRSEDLTREVGSAEEAVDQMRLRTRDVASNLEGRKDALKSLVDEVNQLNSKKNEANEQRKELWKEDQKLIETVRYARDQLQSAERNLYSAMDKNTSAGLKAVARIAEQHQIGGVYGPLYQLFTVPEAYRQSAEVTAGNSLFHVVVDNDDTATRVLDIMQRERAGRVTFMPLNRLRTKPTDYPQNDPEVQPILKKLRYDATYEKAFEQVFSKTLVCEKLETAGAAMRKYGMNVITFDGDKVDRKGALTGGFHDTRRSRLEAADRIKRWQGTVDTDSQRSAEVKRTLTRLDQEITRLIGQIQIADSKLRQAQGGRDPLLAEATSLRQEEERLSGRLAKLRESQAVQSADLRNMKTQLASYQTEVASVMTQTLSDEEADELDTLGQQSEQQRKDLVQLTRDRTDLTSQRDMLQIELRESLQRRSDELKGKLETLAAGAATEGGTEGAADVDERKAELSTLTSTVNRLTKSLATAETNLEKTNATIADKQKELEQTQGKQADDARDIARQQKGTERYHAKRQMLTARKEECNNNIRDLGALPEEAFEKYINVNSDKLVKSLHKVNEALKKFSHVNKKAVEQYTNFTTQKTQLQDRREELETSSASIEELIETLDQRKDEAIERTFRQVSKYFGEVFEKLVPAGRGRLIMQKHTDQEAGAESDEAEDDEMDVDEPKKKKSGIESYTGVAIKVSFNSKSDEGLRIGQLSGGQKSLVALTLVFAIQKCDPAPFYLFDEIDANLDADRRTAIAAMIKELSVDGQFIVTTFRPELLSQGDKHFGVIFDAKKVSSIQPITEEDGMQFVQAQERAA